MAMGLITYRMYLTMSVMAIEHVDVFAAEEAVASWALDHPDWDMDKLATYDEWHLEQHDRRLR